MCVCKDRGWLLIFAMKFGAFTIERCDECQTIPNDEQAGIKASEWLNKQKGGK